MYRIEKVTISKAEVIEAINGQYGLEFPEEDTNLEWNKDMKKLTLSYSEETDI